MAIQPNFHWQFNEREGSIATDHISGVEGKLINNTTFRQHGRIGPAIGMISLGSRVQFGNGVGQFGTGDFTIAFGMQITNTHGQTTLDIIGNRTVDRHGNWVSLRVNDVNRLLFEVDEDSNAKNYIRAQTDKILKKFNWVHVAVVREGTTLRVYVDGVLQAEATSDTGIANISNGIDLRLGHYRQESPGVFYEDLRIYHTALNQVQIQNLIPPLNRLLRPGQIEMISTAGAGIIMTQDEADLFRFSTRFQKLRLGPNTGATLYRGANFTSVSQKFYADVPEIRFTKVDAFPKSVHIWSAVGEPFTGNWIIAAPNGQNLSRNVHTLTTSPNHTDAELFIFHHQPNFDLPLLMPATSQEISLLRVGDEAAVLVVDDSEQHEDAFSITHPEREEWLALISDNTFSWTQQQTDRAIFHRAIKLANNEGQVGELKAGEVALYQHHAYKGKTWILSDNEHDVSGNFTSLRGFAGLDNQVSSIRVGPYTGVTLFANEDQLVNEAKRELEIEDFVDNVPTMAETQIGNDNISSLKIFRTVAPETIFTSVTSKLSQDYRLVNDELEEFSSYRTILRLAPEVKEIEVSATDLTTIEVEDVIHEIDEIRSVILRPNLLNQIMITSEADGISTPGLKFRTSEMAENEQVVIFPHQGVHQQIAELEDDALWNATDAQGNLIVDQNKHTRGEIASVQNTIKRTMATVVTTEDDATPGSNVKAVSGLSRVVSTEQVVAGETIDNPWTLNFQAPPAGTIPEGSAGLVQASPNIWEEPIDQNSFEQLYAQAEIGIEPNATTSSNNLGENFAALSIGGFFRSIGDAVKDAVNVTIGAFEGALNAIIDIGGQLVRFVLDTAKKVADFVTAVVEKVVESIKQFIEFLRFLFDWDDILETKRFLVETINNAIDSVSGMVEAAKKPVKNFFDDLQEGLDDGVDSLIRLIGVDPEEAQEKGFELPEAAEWFLNKLVTGFGKSPLDVAEETASRELSEVLKDLAAMDLPPIARSFLDILEQTQSIPETGTRIRDEVLVEIAEALIANPRRPELVVVGMIEAIRTVANELVNTAEDIALTILDLVIAAIDGLKELINTKINMPLLSALFDLIGAGDLTVLNLTSMLVAIPGTILSKLLFGEAPFKNVSQPEFPAPVATSVLGSFSLQAGEPDIDVDNQRRKVIAFGVIGITADLLNGILSTGLDAVPEPLEFLQRDTTHLEVMSLVLSGVGWLASFPASRVEAGGYPYPLTLDKNKVSKQNDEQEYWERVMWGWRTFVLGFDIVYMAVAAAATRVNPENRVVKALFQVQRLTRGTEITAALTTAFTLVDVGLTGRYLATIPKEDKVGREITNELMGFLPTAFCWMRMTFDPLLWLGLFGINVTSTFVTTGLNIAILKDDVRDLL